MGVAFEHLVTSTPFLGWGCQLGSPIEVMGFWVVVLEFQAFQIWGYFRLLRF